MTGDNKKTKKGSMFYICIIIYEGHSEENRTSRTENILVETLKEEKKKTLTI